MPSLAAMWQALDTKQPVPFDPPVGNLENQFAGRLHVICGDSRWPKSIQSYQRDVEVDRVRYPMLGAASANIGPCAFWPSDPVEPPVQIGDRGPSNVLLVQNLRDPGTPLAGAEKLRKAFGDRARMVTADQGGHGAYGCSPRTSARTTR